MADVNKPVRLSKAAREFNLGIGTIVDFLDSKGITVEANPNTKLDPDIYSMVRGNFQGDKDAKESAQRSSVSKVERESISLASARKPAAVVPEAEPEAIDLSIFRKSDAQPEVKRSNQAAENAAAEKASAEKAAAEVADADKIAAEKAAMYKLKIDNEAAEKAAVLKL
jgi:translation initiation factor IF-2